MLVGQNGRSERLCWELRQPCRLIRRCSSERMQVVPVEDQQNYGEVVGVTEQPAPASGVVVGVLTEQPAPVSGVVVGVVTEQPGASSGGAARGVVDQTRPREDGGSAPVSRRSSDAYSGEPASTEGADPRDEGTVRGERDVEKLAPP